MRWIPLVTAIAMGKNLASALICVSDWLMHGAAHFFWARHGSCAFLLGTAWELRIFAGRSMGMTDPQRGAQCMRRSAVLGGHRWDRGVGIHCLLRVWYAKNGFVQFLEVAAGAGCSISMIFCVDCTPRMPRCWHSYRQLCGASWSVLGRGFVNRPTRNDIIRLVSASTCLINDRR